jgi:hypothetical protein
MCTANPTDKARNIAFASGWALPGLIQIYHQGWLGYLHEVFAFMA